jgi:uncharacterized protein YjdB
MKKFNLTGLLILLLGIFSVQLSFSQTTTNTYIDRFLQIRARIHDPNSGYFSKDGAPYHSAETLMCEAPDQGHESTSEAYSFYIWLEAMYGRVQGDWAPLNSAWSTLEKQTIPTHAMQPNNINNVVKGSKATIAVEHNTVDGYPSVMEPNLPVGTEPVSKELATAYGTYDVYGMHWLFDSDNFYGFGNMGDGVSTPAYINTFQRGPQESTWETVPQPCVEMFKWGGPAGFLDLSVKDNVNAPSKQWKYTNAPDADARAVQAMYWASEWAKAQGKDPATTIPLAKASKMGDFLRLAMFDKYYKTIGVQDKAGAAASGYGSAHYLLSWYYAWGGPLDTTQSWAWKIGCSHSHFGYQNPVAAYALSNYTGLIPKSPNAKTDWQTSLGRQMEMYRWLQSAEGAIGGGCTNSWNGDYSKYPAGQATFYNMAYVENPVYLDPGSNTWFGFQAWSVERVAEYYYLTNNALAKTILDKWVGWVKTVVSLPADGTFSIPSEISWSGQPDTWNPASPGANAGLHVIVKSSGTDIGIAACLAKALTYYAAATKKYGTLDDNARSIAQQLLDIIWTKYWEGSTGKGFGVVEERKDFRRFDSTIYIPQGWTGKMPNGDLIQPGSTFLSIRTKYKSDPSYAKLRAALTAGTNYSTTFHRFWAQSDIALANAEYGYFFGTTTNVPVASVSVSPATTTIGINGSATLTATILPADATNKNVIWSTSNAAFATVSTTGVVTGVAIGTATITVTTVDGAKVATCLVTVQNSNILVTGVTLLPATVTIAPGATSQLTATVLPANATNKNVTWSTSSATVATVSTTGLVTAIANGTATITVTTVDGSKTAISTITVSSCTPTTIVPYVQINSGAWTQTSAANASVGNSIKFGPQPVSGGSWSWSGPNGFAASTREVTITNIQITQAGNYVATYTNASGCKSTNTFVVTVGGTTIAVTGVTLAPTAVSISSGGSAQLTATVVPATATNKTVAWSSSNNLVATVSATGLVTAVGAGTATITVTTQDGNFTATCAVTVTIIPVSVTGVSVTPATSSITVGGTAQLTATVAPATATNKTVAWSSGNNLFATVSATGLVTAVGAGTATITVTTLDGNFTSTCVITVTGGSTSCAFGTPLASALPSISKAFSYIYVLGAGPSFANVSNMTINWDLANKGLYQLSMGTRDGKPNWYVDLRSSATQTFASAQPSITFSGTGFPGLDGNYYAAIDNGNFVLVEKTGAYTIYFSTSAIAPVCTKSAESELGSQQTVLLYPNPFTNKVTLKVSNMGEVKSVKVINQLGVTLQILDVNQFKNSQVEFGDNLPTGIYFIQVKDKENTKVYKVIKK